jgi:fatty-acyl-CoA synthase
MDWTQHCLSQSLKTCVALGTDQPALITPNLQKTWSMLEMEARVLAKAMIHAGVGKGDLIGLMCSNDANWVNVFFASALIGAITVPVNTRFKAQELQYCLKQADVKLHFTMDSFLGIDFMSILREAEPAIDVQLPGLELPLLESVIVFSQSAPKACKRFHEFIDTHYLVSDEELDLRIAQVKPNDVLLIQFTSGTTAYPKGVMLTHENMLHNAHAVSKRIGLAEADRYFNCRPFFHVAGSTLSLLACLETRACLVTLPTFEPGGALEMLAKHRCTFISGNETIFQLLMNHPKFDASLLCLKGGWAAAGPQTMERIVNVLGIEKICWSYGLSEASPNVAKSDYKDSVKDRIEGLAKPLPGLEVKIISPDASDPLPPNVQGEICVRGWSVMKGYYAQAELTTHTIDDEGWLHTGDLGYLTERGHLKFVSRLKDVFRVGGENVAPAEVEEVLLTHPFIAIAQVIGVPDPKYGEVAAAYVSLKDGHSLILEDLVHWLKPKVANFKIPKYLSVVDNFENLGMTASGKIQKNKLKEDASRRFHLN